MQCYWTVKKLATGAPPAASVQSRSPEGEQCANTAANLHWETADVCANPCRQFVAREVPRGEGQHLPFGAIYIGRKLVSVEHQERLHRRVARSLVPVHKRVIHDQRETQRSALRCEIRVQLLTAERHLGLDNGRFDCAQVANAVRSPGLSDD